MKKNIFLIATLALLLTSCEDFLDRMPQGGTMLQEQMESMDINERREWNVRGLYVKIYSGAGGGHDAFGKRSIDLWGDILSGDAAKTSEHYGWLVTDDQMMTNITRNGAIFSYNYGIIHNVNQTIRDDFKSVELYKNFNNYKAVDDYANTYNKLKSDYKASKNATEREELAQQIKQIEDYALLYAQAIAVRGYCYAQLAKWFTPVDGCEYMNGKTIDTYECCPIYTEANMDAPQPLATSAMVYQRAFTDLELAVKIYNIFGKDFVRVAHDKMTFDKEVIQGLLAEAYLNACVFDQDPAVKLSEAKHARDNALEVINSNKYKMIELEDLYTTGFNNVEDKSWMWGKYVTVENAGGLKSWFGQVDIHSYSYAWAGATVAIDADLQAEMNNSDKLWDKRSGWFRSSNPYAGCPDKKFFSAINPLDKFTEDDIDKEWLSDDVFMRIESMYLTAAEACYRLGDYSDAIKYLTELTDKRCDPLEADASYATYKSSLTSQDKLESALIYNWRIEMWGEGYGLQTFRRWNITGRTRGANHAYNTGGAKFDAKDTKFNCNIPSSEATYNPEVTDKEQE